MSNIIDESKLKLSRGEKILLRAKVTPKSGLHKISGVLANDTVKIKLRSAPEHNKANLELIELLSEYFEVPHKNIEILSGHTGAIKNIQIHPGI